MQHYLVDVLAAISAGEEATYQCQHFSHSLLQSKVFQFTSNYLHFFMEAEWTRILMDFFEANLNLRTCQITYLTRERLIAPNLIF